MNAENQQVFKLTNSWSVLPEKMRDTDIANEYRDCLEKSDLRSTKKQCLSCFKSPAGEGARSLVRIETQIQQLVVRSVCQSCVSEFVNESSKKLENTFQTIKQFEAQGRHDQAIELLDQTLALGLYCTGQEDFGGTAASELRLKLLMAYLTPLSEILHAYHKRGMYQQALPIANWLNSAITRLLGQNDPNYVSTLNRLADVHQALGNIEQAEELYRKALTICGNTVGEDNEQYQHYLNRLAGLLIRAGRAAEAKTTSNLEERVVRVFISSTFQDMQAERDILVKRTFPELRERCYQRGVEFVWVDLRWGVTEKEAESGAVLPICLKEIDHCRPFFIGMLGERYGWVPEDIQAELIEEHPWLGEFKDRSLTELEMLYGILLNPESVGRAFFYLRENDVKSSFEHNTQDKVALERLIDLKKRIRSSKYPSDNYKTPEALHTQVLDQLWVEIDKDFPPAPEMFLINQDALGHEGSMELAQRTYIARENYTAHLKNIFSNDLSSPILVLAGKAGIGKTAIIANWVSEMRRADPATFVISHFVGSTQPSTNPQNMLRRIMYEIDLRYLFGEPIPENKGKMQEMFKRWLTRAGGNTLVLVIDGLDFLEDADSGAPLGWLPEYIPWGVRIIFSARPGKSLELLSRRGCQIIDVEGFSVQERKLYVEAYLKQYSKRLDEKCVNQIISSDQSANPGFLRLVLDELNVFGLHDELDSQVNYYLRSTSTEDLFDKILERLERDNDPEKTGVVQRVFSLLWAARYGLSEYELLSIMGKEGNILPRYTWAPLYYSFKDYLVERNGLLEFSQEHLKNAVQSRYLFDTDNQKSVHLELAQYFENCGSEARKADELPWHLMKAGQNGRLRDALTDRSIMFQLTRQNRSLEIVTYWVALGDHYNIADSYRDELKRMNENNESSEHLSQYCGAAGYILSGAGYYAESESFFRNEIELDDPKSRGADKSSDENKANDSSGTLNLANQLYKNGDLKSAKKLYLELLEESMEASGADSEDVIRILNNLGSLLQTQSEMEQAENCYRRAFESSKRTLGEKHDLTITSQCNLGALALEKGDLEQSEQLLLDSLAEKERLLGPEHPELTELLSNLGNLYREKENYELAVSYLERTLSIREKALGNSHPKVAIALNNLATAYSAAGEKYKARDAWQRAMEIEQKTLGHNHPGTVAILSNLSDLNLELGCLDDAEKYAQSAVDAVNASMGTEHHLYIEMMRGMARVMAGKSDPKEAVNYYSLALLQTEKKFGPEHPDTINSINYVAFQQYAAGDFSSCEKSYRRALELRKKNSGVDPLVLADAYNNLATALDALNDYEESAAMYREALNIKEEFLAVDDISTAKTQHSLAVALVNLGK